MYFKTVVSCSEIVRAGWTIRSRDCCPHRSDTC